MENDIHTWISYNIIVIHNNLSLYYTFKEVIFEWKSDSQNLGRDVNILLSETLSQLILSK